MNCPFTSIRQRFFNLLLNYKDITRNLAATKKNVALPERRVLEFYDFRGCNNLSLFFRTDPRKNSERLRHVLYKKTSVQYFSGMLEK